MNRKLLFRSATLWCRLIVLLIAPMAFAQPTVLGTQLVDGSYVTYNLNTVGGFKQYRLLASTAASTGTRNWEFAKGTAASTDYSTTWRPYTSGNTMSTNTFIPTSFANGARFNNPGGASGLLPAITAGTYYTFNVSNLNADNVMALLSTSYNPVAISNVTRGGNYVFITTAATPNGSENIYIRYSSDSFATSTIVAATGSGTSWLAILPTSGTYSYYVYTSNKTLTQINTDVATYGQTVHDMYTLNLNNNGGSNYSYSANNIASNPITGTNPGSVATYTTGQVVNANATASGISRGSGISNTSANDRYNFTNFSTTGLDSSDYFEFTITPNSTYRLNFDSFNFTVQSSGSGPTDIALRSSVDSYAANINATTGIQNGTRSFSYSLTASAFQNLIAPITFRLYGWGGAGTLSVNDYSFNGVVDLAPAAPNLSISGTTTHGTVCPTVSGTPITYTITNNGSVAAAGVTVVSSDPQFVVSGLSSTTIASGGGTATYQVTFTPSASGAQSATVTVASTTSGSNSPTSALTGTGATPATAAVTTNAASAVTTTTATLNGNVTTLGVCPASTFKGFVYALTATNATPTIGGTGVTGTTPVTASTGAFTAGLTGLATGSSYSFRAYIYNGTTYTYGSVLTFTTLAPPANDDCANAIALTLGAAAVTGNTANGTQSLAGCTGNANDDVWYSFQTTVAGTYTITVVGSASFDAVVDVRSGACNGTNLFCVDDFASGGTETALATGLAANTTYLVRVYDFNTAPATSTFTIAVTAPQPSLSASASSLTFGNSNVLTPTTSQTFNLSGSALSGAPGNITVTAPNTNFQVSNDNATWGASTTIAYATSTLAATPVYVRFVPQSSGAKTGNVTFSGGGVVTPPTVSVTGTGVLPAPTATAATNITATSFDANWTAVTGATAYLLDVSTSSTFSTPGGPASVTESFETGLSTSYQTGNVTLGTGVWAVTNVLKGTSGVNSGTASAQLQSATGSALVSPTFTNITTVTFWVTSSTASGAMQVNYSTDGGSTWTPASNSPFTGLGTTRVQKTVTLNLTGDVKLQFLRTAATISLDDIVINYSTSTPSFVSGYNALNVGNVTTYTVSGLTAGTTYYYRVRATDGTPSAYSNTITVDPASAGGTAVANQTICSGSTPADLTLSGNIGNVIRWERASDVAFTAPVTISNTTTTLPGATIGALTSTTYFRAVVQSGSNPVAYSTTVMITVNPASVGGTVTGGTTVCTGTNSTTLTLSGNTGTIQWQSSPDNSTFTDISGATGTTYTATNLTATTYYRAVVTSGVCASANSTVATVTVNPASVGGTVSGGTTVCAGTNSTTLTLSGNTGTIQWQSSSDNTTFTDISGATGTTYTATNLTATTYYHAIVTSGVCAPATSTVATITVNATPVAGTASADQSVCAGSTAADLTLTGSTGTIQWQSSTDNITFTDIAGETSATLSSAAIGALSTTTYFHAVVTSGICGSVTSNVVTITVGSTTWDGTSWSNGTPTATTGIVITGDYTTSGDLSGCSMLVSNNATVTVASGTNITLVGALTVNTGSSFVVESNANLIQQNDVDNSGAITVARDSNPLMRLDYTLWSSPVVGQNLGAFSPLTTTNRFYVYNPSTDLYNTIDPAGNSFAEGVGYLIRMPNNHPTTPTVWTGTFTGEPHNGNVSVSVSSNTYNAVGNPYPSTIDADAFITANSLTEALYFWRKTNNAATTSYATYTLAGGAGTSANSGDPNSLVPNGIIQVGQGFIARATSSSLVFNNGMRVADNNNQFFRAAQVERNRIWLNMTADGIFSQTMVSYMTGGTSGVDAALDGHYFNDSQVALTSMIGTEEFAVQARALPFDITDVVPLGFKVVDAGTYTISLDHVDGLFENGAQHVYLKDNLDSSIHDLNVAAYSFAAEAGVANDRFEIVYQTALGTVDFASAGNVIAFKKGLDIAVQSAGEPIASVRVFDLRGRLIAQQHQLKTKSTAVPVQSANGVLLVRVTLANGVETMKKVVY